MSKKFSRTEALIGAEAIKKLAGSTVCIFGIGGVGSFALEAVVRAGVGTLIIADHAVIDESNINRQLIALESTVGTLKTEAAAARIKDINPDATVITHNIFIDETNTMDVIPPDTDYILDAIDSVKSKLAIIEYANKNNIPVVSCMGTGNKLHPEKLQVSDIFKTSVDPLARIMRSELKKRGIKKLNVVWSDENPLLKGDQMPENKNGKKVPASISYVPSSAGLLMASVAVSHLAELK